jgi:tetratricopeptide (TPR) repeat protein
MPEKMLVFCICLYYHKYNKFLRMKKVTPFYLAPLICMCVYSSAVFAADSPSVSEDTKKMASQYRDQGLKAQQTGDFDTALMYFQKCVEMDPSLAVTYNDLGVLYEAKGWTDKAKIAYGRAIDLDPMLPSPYYNLGSIYAKEGDFDKAVSYFKKRVMVGEWNDTWTEKARQELKGLGVSDPEIRKDFLDKHLASLESMDDIRGEPKGNDLDPRTRKRDAKWYLFRGKQLASMGQYMEALKALSMAEVLDPRNKEIEKTLELVHRKALLAE